MLNARVEKEKKNTLKKKKLSQTSKNFFIWPKKSTINKFFRRPKF